MMVKTGSQVWAVQIIVVNSRHQINVNNLRGRLDPKHLKLSQLLFNEKYVSVPVRFRTNEDYLGGEGPFWKVFWIMNPPSSSSFYQLNPEQTEVLYSEAVKGSRCFFRGSLIDAYCGVETDWVYFYME